MSAEEGMGSRVGGYAAAGLRWWEPRRLGYNAVLASVAYCAACVFTLTHFFSLGLFRVR